MNLLTSSADNRKKVDSSFIEILKQMDELDAKLFKKIFNENQTFVGDISLLKIIRDEEESEEYLKPIQNKYLP